MGYGKIKRNQQVFVWLKNTKEIDRGDKMPDEG